MIYAQIKNGKVVNTIVIDNTDLLGIFSQGFDYLIQIDNLIPMPGIGWLYDGQNFSMDEGT